MIALHIGLHFRFFKAGFMIGRIKPTAKLQVFRIIFCGKCIFGKAIVNPMKFKIFKRFNNTFALGVVSNYERKALIVANGRIIITVSPKISYRYIGQMVLTISALIA